MKVAAGTPVARQGTCVTDYQIAWDVTERLQEALYKSVNQGTTPKDITGKKLKGIWRQDACPGQERAEPKQVFNKATAC
jgi:hypothetical protein